MSERSALKFDARAPEGFSAAPGATFRSADPHVPRRSFGRGRLLVSKKEIVIEPFRRNVEFRSGK